jgi:LysR family glycine cleavage system transcriptional activator
VSKAIHLLEDHLGTRLFHRHHRAIELTAEGSRFYVDVAASFDRLYATASTLEKAPLRESINVSFSSVFVTFWLLPRLDDFKQRYPGLSLHLDVNDRDDKNLLREDIDLSSRLGEGAWSGLRSWHYADEEVIVVCSPGYLATRGPIDTVEDLPRHQLLQLDESYRVRIGWKEWLHNNNVDVAAVDYHLAFNDSEAVLQAVLRDQGLALGWRHLVERQLRSGKLVQPVPNTCRSGLGLYLIAPEGPPMKRGAELFRDWILEQADAVAPGRGNGAAGRQNSGD